MAFVQMSGSTPAWEVRKEQAGHLQEARQVDRAVRAQNKAAVEEVGSKRNGGATQVSLTEHARARAAYQASPTSQAGDSIDALPSILSGLENMPAAMLGAQTGKLSRDAATALIMGV